MVGIALRLGESLGAAWECLEPKVWLIHSTSLMLLLLVHAAWLLIARVIRRRLCLVVREKCWVGPIAWCRHTGWAKVGPRCHSHLRSRG